MSYLKGRRCYLSGPIEYDTGLDWRTEPKKILTEQFEIDLTDPNADPKQQWATKIREAKAAGNYDVVADLAHSFVRKDLCLVDRSDFLIACLPYNVYTTGTVHEIINSNNAKKPTLIICPEGKNKIPSWYFGFVPHHYMFGSWRALYEYLGDVDLGYEEEDSRWHYVYGLI